MWKFCFKKIMWVLCFTLLVIGGVFYSNQVTNTYFYLTRCVYWAYEKDKALILPYFDEAFYKREYAEELKLSGQEPIDHFLQRSTRLGGGDFDPNSWFNVTLYKERLWPCSGNPFVDFLQQPSLNSSETAQVVEIYSNQEQFHRAWMAVEAFMRRQKFKVILILPESFKAAIPLCFQPIIKRGLIVQFSDDPQLSFYHSPFLKRPDDFGVSDLKAVTTGSNEIPITRFRRSNGSEYLMHRLYNYTKWQQNGRINPCMINFAQYCFEPIEFSNFGHDEYTFKQSMKRLASGFDLLFINSDIGVKNLRIIPGYLHTHINPKETPKNKKFEVSFLLSLGGKGFSSFKTRGSFVYHFRKIIWYSEQKMTTIPTKFYLSRRDMDKYPEDLRKRVLPSDSKQWIFDSQFSIAIENSRQAYYFSEKLIDCFLSLTVPIYIGCPNIKDYFDERGMFIAKDPDDVIRIVQSLTPDTYEKMLPYLIENKKRAEKLMILEDGYIEDFFRSIH